MKDERWSFSDLEKKLPEPSVDWFTVAVWMLVAFSVSFSSAQIFKNVGANELPSVRRTNQR